MAASVTDLLIVEAEPTKRMLSLPDRHQEHARKRQQNTAIREG
jgi:hypothetical protein